MLPYREDASKKTKIDTPTTTGAQIVATPGKTTTILGRFDDDTEDIIKELGNIKSLDFGPRDGYFNLLNIPDEMVDENFWENYNKPWLDNAIARNDIIYLATPPTEGYLQYTNEEGKVVLTGFGKEIKHLIENGYEYDTMTKTMIKVR
ncbi:MAG: hypothetical protein E7270_09095 [Lachnospiraceae bacterium]|nr:hypothetical protein [Lachnospiraceae bacterium]